MGKSPIGIKGYDGVIITQLPKLVVKTIPSTKLRFNLPLEMGTQTCRWIKAVSRHFKKLGPKSF
jgi:hypothetical protein